MMKKGKKSFKLYLIFFLIIIILISSLALSQIENDDLPLVKVISFNENGVPYRESYGFIAKLGAENVIVTDYYVVEEVNSAKVVIDKANTLTANVLKDPKTQTAILIPKSKHILRNRYVYMIGDSSSIVPGEKLFIPNEKGKKDIGIMENLLPSFSKYYNQTMVTTFKNHVPESGKPILNYRNEVVGMLTFYQKDRIVVPINTFKDVYYDYYQKKKSIVYTPKKEVYKEPKIPVIPINIRTETSSNEPEEPVFVNNIFSKNNNCFLGEIAKIQFGIDGHIYVLDKAYKRIYKFDNNYNLLKGQNKNGISPQLENPISFAITKAGIIYVLENLTSSSIKIFNRNLELIKEVKFKNIHYNNLKGKRSKINLKLPNFDIEAGEQRVYVLSKNKILVFDEKLNMLREMGGNGVGKTYFKSATDISVLNDDKLVVLDQEGACVKLFDADSEFLLDFPIHAPVNNAITTYRGENVIVVDKSNSKIKLFDKNGNFLRLYQVNTHSPYGVAKGVIFDNKEQFHVYYENQSHIIVFNTTGTPVNVCSSFSYDSNRDGNSLYSSEYDYNKYSIYKPKNIALTKRNVVMADFNNYIHIFEKTDVKEESIDEESESTDEEEEGIDEENIDETGEKKNIIDAETVVLPIDYRFNISGLVGDKNSDTIYFSESIKGTIYKYDINAGTLTEILLKLKYLAYDFIPILAHFDGELLYIIDKLNQRIIVTDTNGVTKAMKTISYEISEKNLPVIDVTTIGSGREKEIFILTKKAEKFYIYEFNSDWEAISQRPPIEVKNDFTLGEPKSIAIYNHNIFITNTLENKILTLSTAGTEESYVLDVPNNVNASYLNKPSEIIINENSLYVLDEENNRTIEYKISGGLR